MRQTGFNSCSQWATPNVRTSAIFKSTFTIFHNYYKNIQNSTKNMSVMTKCQPTMLNHFHTTGCKCPLCHTGKLFLTTNLYTILSSIDKNFVL